MAKFQLGKVYVTRGIDDKTREDFMFGAFVTKSFERHSNGDWGDLCEEDKALNDNALKNGDDRIFSSYTNEDGTKIWIITEWDRSVTTILFPDEY